MSSLLFVKRGRCSVVVAATLAACGAFSASPARAQSAPIPPQIDAAAQAAERAQREQQDRDREQLRQAQERATPPTVIETPAVPKPRVNASIAVKRDIRELRIDGATLMSPAFRADLTARYQGRALDLSDVERLLTEITKYYLDRGYVTARAYIPDQDLTTGVLRILVIEGRIAKLQGAGHGNLFPTKVGEVLNLRDLEQGIDNLNRLQSHHATLDLAPGAQPGDTEVLIHDLPTRPWHLSVSADNTGSKDTGKDQVSATVGADDLLGFGENYSVTHRRAFPYHAGSQASESTTGLVSVPWGYESFSLGGSTSSYALSFAAPSGLDLPFTGTSKSLFLRTDRVVYRGQIARLSAYANLQWKSSRNYLNGSLIGVSSRDASTLDVGAVYTRPLAGGYASLDAAISQGLPIFGAAKDPAGLPHYAPHGTFTALKVSASWSRNFHVRERVFSFNSSLTAQATPQVLYGADQLTIGGVYAVRGFDRSNLAGDCGYVWRNDLSTIIPVRAGAANRVVNLRPYVGIDHGHAWSNVSGIAGYSGPSGTLLGGTAGLGLSYQRYNADLSYSQSLVRAASMPREDGHFYFRVNASF